MCKESENAWLSSTMWRNNGTPHKSRQGGQKSLTRIISSISGTSPFSACPFSATSSDIFRVEKHWEKGKRHWKFRNYSYKKQPLVSCDSVGKMWRIFDSWCVVCLARVWTETAGGAWFWSFSSIIRIALNKFSVNIGFSLNKMFFIS